MLVLLGMVPNAATSANTASVAGLEIRTLSNRADLISGGDALVEVVLPTHADPAKVRVNVNGRDVTSAFAVRPNGQFTGLIQGLRVGKNQITARVKRTAARLTITNHPSGGPVFSGPQIEPWFCDTEAAGLGTATDKDCNAPTRYDFFYKNAASGQFDSYNRQNPPPESMIATTTTDQGHTVPYIVRVETGTINRGIYEIAVLFNPTRPWRPWAPQKGWNGKLNWVFGCDGTPGHRQATDRTCALHGGVLHQPAGPLDWPEEQHRLLNDMALGRGFAVAASTQTNLGNNINTTIHAETMMMVKERMAERYGPTRYTIGTGCSGGSIAQHGIANQYPGLIQGLRPECSFADVWSIATVNSHDCPLLNRYFDETSSVPWTAAQRDAVYGYEVDAGPGNAAQGNVFCHQSLGNFRPSWWDPSVGGEGSDSFAAPAPCVPQSQVYDAQHNPRGVRCSLQDYIVNIVGRRPSKSWGPVERSIGQGFANRFLDNVGLQYGLGALEAGAITAEQFVDLNERVGGWDIDANWQAERTRADIAGVRRMYRSGQIVEGHQLEKVAIIDYRGDWNYDVHSNRQSAIVRERLRDANGHLDNRAEWLAPSPTPDGWAPDPELSFRVMDQWLERVEADTSNDPRPVKIVRNRPPQAADGCFQDGQRTEAQACAHFSVDEDPRLVAGMPDARDILKCQLKPLTRSDYRVAFTDGQWARLNKAFPNGVCDWSKLGVGQRPNTPWLSYATGPGGERLGAPPRSKAIRLR